MASEETPEPDEQPEAKGVGVGGGSVMAEMEAV